MGNADRPYIVRVTGTSGPQRYVQAARVVARRVEILKRVGHLGPFVEMKGTGRYRTDVLTLLTPRDTSVDGYGRRPYPAVREHVARSAAGVKKAVRRIRPQEAERLDLIDARIEAVQAELADLRDKRRAALADAWANAHVVRLAEVEALIDAPLDAP